MKKATLEAINAVKGNQKTPWTKEERAYISELYHKHGLTGLSIFRLGVFPGRSAAAIAEQVQRVRK